MSALQPLVIRTGVPWSWVLTIKTAGVPVPIDPPVVMEFRRDVNSASQLLARLSTDGDDGTIEILGPGLLQMRLPHTFTRTMATGRGFWDVFSTVAAEPAELASGAVNILPHVSRYPA